MTSSVLVTGANRGIGLGLVRTLIAQPEPPTLLIATCRNPQQADELQKIASSNSSVKILSLDVLNVESFPAFAESVSAVVGENGLNVLINNAAVGPAGQNSIRELSYDNFTNLLNTNVVGTIFLTKALLPLIEKAAKNNAGKPKGMKRAAILNISSLVGSLGDNKSGGMYGYRESKTAINMFSMNLKKDLEGDGILVLPLHPGWVLTDMGGPNAPVTVEASTAGLVNILYTLDESKNGQFLNYDGKVLPW